VADVVLIVLVALGAAGVAGAIAGCGGEAAAPPPVSAVAAPRGVAYPVDDASWGRFHSKRFLLSVSLPDGRAWKIDDRSQPWLVAAHEPTSSKLVVLGTQEDELMNRHRCETRARELGWVGPALTTVEEQVTVGPEAYDSRVWVAIEAARGGGLSGHVYLFGAFLRKCLLVHLTTTVASAGEEAVLSDRLAVASARMIRGLRIDPPRVTDDATVPRAPHPEPRR